MYLHISIQSTVMFWNICTQWKYGEAHHVAVQVSSFNADWVWPYTCTTLNSGSCPSFGLCAKNKDYKLSLVLDLPVITWLINSLTNKYNSNIYPMNDGISNCVPNITFEHFIKNKQKLVGVQVILLYPCFYCLVKFTFHISILLFDLFYNILKHLPSSVDARVSLAYRYTLITSPDYVSNRCAITSLEKCPARSRCWHWNR